MQKAAQNNASEPIADMIDDIDVMQSVFASAPSNIAIYDREGRILLANPTLASYVGRPLTEIQGKFPDEFPELPHLVHLRKTVQKTAEQVKPAVLEIPLENADGTAGIHVINLIPVPDTAGTVGYVIGYGRNIANIDKLKAAVAEAEDQLHAAIKVLPDIFWIKDAQGRYQLCNEQFDLFNGIERGSALGRKASDLSSGPIYELHDRTDKEAMASLEPVRFEIELPANQHQGPRFYDVQKTAIRDSKGRITGLLGMARDVTKRHNLELELRIREREYRHLAEHLPDCLIRYDTSAKPVYMNAALLGILVNQLDVDPEALMQGAKIPPPNDMPLQGLRSAVYEVLESGQPQQLETTFTCIDGTAVIHEVRLFPEFDEDGHTISAVGIGRDITASKHAQQQLEAKEQELRYLAYTDSLTGLANRATFTGTLTDLLEEASAKGKKIALLTLDIDRLKSINDTLGHAMGDDLLRKMAQRLQIAADNAAWIGRLGGDEFALILSGLDQAECGEKLARKIIQKASQPVNLDGITVNVSMSIGITVGPDDSPCPSTLFRYSDIALYAAKALGRGGHCRFNEDMNRAFNKRFEMEAMINDGLRSDQFVAHFQPKTGLRTSQIEGAETLCRWYHPEKGFISPAEFIPIAEETGQIIEIGRRILKQACEIAVTCNANRTDPFVIAVNVSARQLLYGGFLSTLGLCLEETGCKASWLELEITESLLLIDDEAIIETLNTITNLGTTVSLDDFGTGYSALSYLLKFPISGLKIDQSFIRELDKGGKQEVLVRTILTMAQSLGLKTVAEGIETAETAEQLAELGCDEGQGFYWHRPMAAEDFLALTTPNPDRRQRI